MKKWRIYVLGECGWASFIAGFCAEPETANAQMALFQNRYPQRAFNVGMDKP